MTDRSPCACGSGLRKLRCCGLDLGSLSPRDASGPLQPLVEQAEAAEGRDSGQAIALCLQVLELAPGQEQALAVLYRLRKAEPRPAAAEALIRRLVAVNPNNFWATNELALLLLAKGRLSEAELHARNAVRIAPRNPQAHNLMGLILTEGNRPQFGEFHYRRALALLEAPDAILLANLAWNLKAQGRMSEAREFYRQSVALKPDVLETLLGWARMEEADRDFPAALALLDRADCIAPGNPSVRLARAVLHGRRSEFGIALSVLDRMAQAEAGGLGPAELSERGRLLDRMGRHPEAFAAFIAGKQRLRELSGRTYLADEAASLAASLKSFFTERRLSGLPRAGVRTDAAQPIFILGFPRSGTTLVEQTLSAHPEIAAGDELPLVHDIVAILPRLLASPLTYPDALAELWMADHREDLDTLRDHYLARVRQFGVAGPAARWFTDKMPLNEMHLGLIALLFPAAPLIHVLRHPLDVVLSVFSNHLTHGFHCAAELETIARHYVLVMDLVRHYRTQMTLRYLPLRYEELVADQEASVARMLAFIGAPFDRRCLRFHENRRYARTASYAQVTEALYDRSCFRHLHYLKELAPVLPILAPWIERLGYRVGPDAEMLAVAAK